MSYHVSYSPPALSFSDSLFSLFSFLSFYSPHLFILHFFFNTEPPFLHSFFHFFPTLAKQTFQFKQYLQTFQFKQSPKSLTHHYVFLSLSVSDFSSMASADVEFRCFVGGGPPMTKPWSMLSHRTKISLN